MKPKIQHDAINNQEDEDSSAYPLYLLSGEGRNKKRSAKPSTSHFAGKVSKGEEKLALKQKDK